MKRRHIRRNPVSAKKLSYLSVVVLALAMIVSCVFPQGQHFWNSLIQTARLSHFTSALPEDALHIHVIDVGKADAILIESPEAALLVDAGTADSAGAVKRYLANRQIETLDAVWISHADSDHAGGLEAILQSVSAKEIVRSAYSALPDTLPESAAASAGEVREYGDITLEVLGPRCAYESENDNSLVFRLHYGDFTMLFCGDIEAKAENDLLSSGQDMHADVLKVPHHGSNTSTSAEFLSRVDPDYAVISVGIDRNNLPRNAVLKRLNDSEIRYFRTDRDGSVVISTDGVNINIITENTGSQPVSERSNKYEENDH